MQVIRLLHLPDTLSGYLVDGAIQLFGLYFILRLCVTQVSGKRFALVAVPAVLVGGLWQLYYRGMSPDGQEIVGLVTAVAFGIGVGGMIAIWVLQRRDHGRELKESGAK